MNNIGKTIDIRRYYFDFIHDQYTISHISTFLKYMGTIGYSIVYYGRPESNNKLYPNIEVIFHRNHPMSVEEGARIRNWLSYHRDSELFSTPPEDLR